MILGRPLLGSLGRRRSSGAEQLSCKQQVVGSNPTAGSLETRGSRPRSDPFGRRGEEPEAPLTCPVSLNPISTGADARRMNTRPRGGIQGEREAMFLGNMDAFMRRDFATIEGSLRSDIILELPGTSWLAGSSSGTRK